MGGTRPHMRREDEFQAYTRICSATNKMAALCQAFVPGCGYILAL